MSILLGYLVEANVLIPTKGTPLIYDGNVVKAEEFDPLTTVALLDNGISIKTSDPKLSRVYFMTPVPFKDIPNRGLVYTVDSQYNIGSVRYRSRSDSQLYYRGRSYFLHDGIVASIWEDYRLVRNHPENILYPIRLRTLSDLTVGFPPEDECELNEDAERNARETFYRKVGKLYGDVELNPKSKTRLCMVFGNTANVQWSNSVVTQLLDIRRFVELK